MHIYRFRVLCDGVDEFVREIEVGSHQTFLVFLYSIYECTTLERKGDVSFYISNIRWLKIKEIGLNERSAPKNFFDDEEELRADERRRKLPFTLMANALMRDFIEDPHQRIILEHPGGETRIFYIELLKIAKSSENISYPRCVVSKGELPVKVQFIAPVMPVKPAAKKNTLLEELSLMAQATEEEPDENEENEEDTEDEADDSDDESQPEADEEIDDELIGKDIEEMLGDETFSKILAGESPEPKARRNHGGGRKPKAKSYDDDDDILADLDVDDEDEGGTYGRETYGSDEEDFGSGFEISGGNNDDDYY